MVSAKKAITMVCNSSNDTDRANCFNSSTNGNGKHLSFFLLQQTTNSFTAMAISSLYNDGCKDGAIKPRNRALHVPPHLLPKAKGCDAQTMLNDGAVSRVSYSCATALDWITV